MRGTTNHTTHALQVGTRVLLRRPRPEDGDELIALNSASRDLHRGWVSPPVTAQQFAAYRERCDRDDFEGLLVCLRDTGAIIGVFNLSQIFRGPFQNAYLGYYAGSAYVGQGYMSEGLELTLRHAFNALKLHRIEANIQPGNSASLALVQRAGFTLEGYSRRYLKVAGRWRDHLRWALLAEDWLALRRLSRDATQRRPSQEGGPLVSGGAVA